MPRVSKRKKKETEEIQNCYSNTYIYVRLSEKDGGHGRKDSIAVQEQICRDFAKKHPELLIMGVYTDNGVSGATFERPGFERLMEEVRSGKVDCIIVKDFSRFGRDALDAVELIDIIFPTLGVRFISVLDEYDSDNPACGQERINNILKHFMNDYYAKEVSAKQLQSHKITREKGEFRGTPPYGYRFSEESTKILVPDEEEKEIVQRIFYSLVFENMSTIEIAKSLNADGILSPRENYEMRKYGKTKNNRKTLWNPMYISQMLQNPVYIGAGVYGKTKRMLCMNVPYSMVPRAQWEIKENLREPLVEKAVFDKSIEIMKERWKKVQAVWAPGADTQSMKNLVFKSKVVCEKCGRKMQPHRIGKGKYKYTVYVCPTVLRSADICNLRINIKYISEAVRIALQYQINLAAEYKKKQKPDMYDNLKKEIDGKIKRATDRYEAFGIKLDKLFEHYATGFLDKDEYLKFKENYLNDQEKAHKELVQIQKKGKELLHTARMKIEWADELLKCQNIKVIDRNLVEHFIYQIEVVSRNQITVRFIFEDIFDSADVGGEADV